MNSTNANAFTAAICARIMQYKLDYQLDAGMCLKMRGFTRHGNMEPGVLRFGDSPGSESGFGDLPALSFQ